MPAQGSRKFRRAFKKCAGIALHSEAFSAEIFLRIQQAPMLLSWAAAWENVPWTPRKFECVEPAFTLW
jgi:hypothetical protein